jgi:hypothetical protein
MAGENLFVFTATGPKFGHHLWLLSAGPSAEHRTEICVRRSERKYIRRDKPVNFAQPLIDCDSQKERSTGDGGCDFCCCENCLLRLMYLPSIRFPALNSVCDFIVFLGQIDRQKVTVKAPLGKTVLDIIDHANE